MPLSQLVAKTSHKYFYSPKGNSRTACVRKSRAHCGAGGQLCARRSSGRVPGPGSPSIWAWAWAGRTFFGPGQNCAQEFTKGVAAWITRQWIKDAFTLTSVDRFCHTTEQGRFANAASNFHKFFSIPKIAHYPFTSS